MLDIRKREVGKTAVLSLEGELDLDGAQNLKVFLSSLPNDDYQKVIINWSDVERINYTSLQMVTPSLQDLGSLYPMAFCGLSEQIQKSLKSAPFFEKVKLFDSEDRALSRF